MSRDLEHLLNATAAEPSRPVDPAEISRLARKRRWRRHTATAIAGVAATAGLVTTVALPSLSGADDVTAPPAADPGPADVQPPAEAPLCGVCIDPVDVESPAQALADTVVAFATEPSNDTAAALPLAETVELGLGPDLLIERTKGELSDPAAWAIDRERVDGDTEPFSALETIRHTSTKMAVREYREDRDRYQGLPWESLCAWEPPPPPDSVADMQRVSVQADKDIVATLQDMFYVDLYVDEDGLIHAVTLTLCVWS
jgi:hypothetical protein